ncbi:MAG: hypothetical protein M1142_02010 [Patescibacteria group bacterium]|nr:hypothetical protein [Patescibacteria group bacterium]
MSDQSVSSVQNDNSAPLPPPVGDPEKASYYTDKLTELVSTDKLTVMRTDLAKFDPTSLQDHYRLDLNDYEVEISHNKQPDSGKDFYVMLFNNLKHISNGCTEKAILAYIHISGDQFAKFKTVADDQIDRKRKEAEEKRFKEAMAPIDQALEQLNTTNSQPAADNTQAPTNHIPPVFAQS